MAIRKILESIGAGLGDSGTYVYTFRFDDGANPGDYRVRLFFKYDGYNDLTSRTGAGLYAVSDDPDNVIYYDDWNGYWRRPYIDLSDSGHDSSFNVEVDCEFSGENRECRIELMDRAGNSPAISGESFLNGTYRDGNLPVNVLMEKRDIYVGVETAVYDTETRNVIVTTVRPHGFSDGDAVSMTGFPTTDHSCGVNGERYNGTYYINVLSPTKFSYRSKFFEGCGQPTLKYDDCLQVVATKWITCEYLVDIEDSSRISTSVGSALVIWPSHTFKECDRVTLMDGDEPVASDAVLGKPTANVFVCRSRDIGLGTSVTAIAYAPRTPVSDVPANYAAPTRTGGFLLFGGGTGESDHLVDNSSAYLNSAEPRKPYSIYWFDLDHPEYGKAPVDGGTPVSSRKFTVITFTPPPASEVSTGNTVKFTLYTKASTEVSTAVCVNAMLDRDWDISSTAREVMDSMSKVPLDCVTIDTSDTHDDCVYDNDRKYEFTVDSSVADKWCAEGVPVSVAFTLYGRDGAEVIFDTEKEESFRVTTVGRAEPRPGEFDPVDIAVMPSILTPGDTVTVYAMDDSSDTGFDFLTGNLRIRLNGETDPDKWAPVMTNDGTALTFVMPEGYSGDITLTVMRKFVGGGWDSAEACSGTVTVTAHTEVPKTVTMNVRMKPGEIDRKVSRTAAYNRDLGYKGFSEITDENSMIQNLYSCILTRKGERLFNPDFGTTIEERIFSLRTGTTSADVLKECLQVISEYEPRINLVYEQCSVQDMGQHGIYLQLGVIIPGGTVENITIPFKNRGRMV